MKRLRSTRQMHREIIDEARRLMNRLDPEPAHAVQVCRLALQLFDELAPLHQLNQEARMLLEAGALLHDIGWSVSEKGHNKHSARLIEAHGFQNASTRQMLQIAALARYHRKAHPKSSHRIFQQLDPEAQSQVRCLAALLRIADGLDRSHLNLVERLHAEVRDNRCVLSFESRQRCPSELWAAERKSGLFEEVFGLRVEFQPI